MYSRPAAPHGPRFLPGPPPGPPQRAPMPPSGPPPGHPRMGYGPRLSPVMPPGYPPHIPPPRHPGMAGQPPDYPCHHPSGYDDRRSRSERERDYYNERDQPPSSSRTAAGGQLNAKQLSSHISNAGSADALLTLFAAHASSLNHIHAANLWNKLGKQRVERRHEEQLGGDMEAGWA